MQTDNAVTRLMLTMLRACLLWTALLGLTPGFCVFAASSKPAAGPAGLPIRFEAVGASEYRSRGGRQAVVLRKRKIAIGGAAGSLVMTFPGSRSAAPVADDRQPSIANYFLGADPRGWRTNVPDYSRVRYRNLYPGIDLVFYGRAGRLEYDFAVSPGADPSQIRIALAGAERVSLAEHGDLAFTAAGADLVFLKPEIYQDARDGRHTVAGSYRLTKGTVGFDIGNYDRSLPLIIDPALTYATFFGGTGDEYAYAVATDPSGNMYIAGSTSSIDLHTTTHATASQFGGGHLDCFVAKFSPSGALLYSTYLGGSGGEEALGLAVDTQGNAYITGYTTSHDFPRTANAYSSSLSGSTNAFVAKLNPAGTALLYSSYLGGSGSDTGNGIAVDGAGDMFITGRTSSPDFPVSQGSYQNTFAGGGIDAFVTALSASGTLIYSTYLGGSGEDLAYAIALDPMGDAYVVGATLSADFPNIPGDIQGAENGGYDGFVTAINTSGTALIYSTFLGGSSDDDAFGVAVDSAGNAYVTGQTASTDFPHTSGVLQPANAGGYDAFVAKISPTGAALVYSTFLGGSGDDYALPIAVDSGGNAYITGSTNSSDFPVTADGVQSNPAGVYAAFVAVLNSDASAQRYGTYLGGSSSQAGWGMALSPGGGFIAAGHTNSSDFPVTAGSFQPALAGTADAFVAVYSALPLPVLSIAGIHDGNFTQGQEGATYTLTVSNGAAAATTSGAVTVADTLPVGLTATAIGGDGWACTLATLTCTCKSALAAGDSYPEITLTVNVANDALATVTNQVSVSGGSAAPASSNDPTTIIPLPALTIASTHGSFTQGQAGATYSVTVSNGAAAGPTSGTATVTDTLPTGLTATAIGGDGWVCTLATLICTRSDALPAGASYLPIVVTVNVANNAPAAVTNQVSVSGGNSAPASASDPTTIILLPVLSISKTHNGNFTQRQTGATYSVTVSNSSSAGPTSGTVTVTDTLPIGLAATAIGGNGWACTLATLICTRSEVLQPGGSYLPITVTVTVAENAAASLTNQASASVAGSATANASDPTTIVQLSACDVNGDGVTDVVDVQLILGEALGALPPVYDLHQDGVVNVADVQIVINAVLSGGCSVL